MEIGPCKHGKYKDSIFQETYVYDIIAHVDALRHTILTGDKVLAPMEPDGERYSPGVVIDGQEKRYAEGKKLLLLLGDACTIGLFTTHFPVFFWPLRYNFRDIELKYCIFS